MGLLTLSQSEKTFLSILQHESNLTDQQLSDRMNCSTKTISRMLSKLDDLNLIHISKIRYSLGGNWVNTRTIEVKENS